MSPKATKAAAASSSAARVFESVAVARSSPIDVVTASIVAATFGIQKVTAWPSATYACCAARASLSASAVSRARTSNVRNADATVATCCSERKRKKAAAPSAIQAIAPQISRDARDRIFETEPEYHNRFMLTALLYTKCLPLL